MVCTCTCTMYMSMQASAQYLCICIQNVWEDQDILQRYIVLQCSCFIAHVNMHGFHSPFLHVRRLPRLERQQIH
jgi:hypothetical protein